MIQAAASDAIDFVYTWVDGEKNAVLRKKFAEEYAKIESNPDGERSRLNDASGGNRFKDNREIVQSIASVRIFAPFVNKIFIVAADGQIPDWYTASEYPEVEMVFHSHLFGKEYASLLPTFNSHTIEAMLPFISGLSERFVYFNDDMFLGAPVTPEDFYDPDGTAVVRVRGEVEPFWQTHKKAWRVYRGNMYAAMQKRYPDKAVYDSAHQCRTLLKSSCINAWNDPVWKELLIDTAKDKFRSLSNIPPIELFTNVMLIENRARPVTDNGIVLQLFDGTVFGPEFSALGNMQPKFYCINDDMISPSRRHLGKLQHYLTCHLPHHKHLSSAGDRHIRRARPRVGAIQLELAHAISWCWRILGKVIGVFKDKGK